MVDFIKRYQKTLIDLFLLLFLTVSLLYFSSMVIKIAAPVVLGYVFFVIIEPLAGLLHKKGLKKSVSSGISIFAFLIIFAGISTLFIATLITQTENVINNVPKYNLQLQSQIDSLTIFVNENIDRVPTEISEKSAEVLEKTVSEVSAASMLVLKDFFKAISSIPTLIFNVLLGLILAYFLSVEKNNWKRFYDKNAPNTFKKLYSFLRDNVMSGIKKYASAQFKLIGITFLFVLIGLLILRVENAFMIALVSAIFDILPLLGISAIFLPWIAYTIFISKDIGLAIALGVILVIVILFRQFAEPKLVGESLGVSAFVMLASMVVFLSLFGVAGMILTPLIVIVLKELVQQGYLSTWIRKPEGEYEEEKPE